MVQGLLYSLISACAFGTLAIFVKLGYRLGMDGMDLLEVRFLTGTALLFLVLLIRDRSLLRPRPGTLPRAALLGVALYGAMSSLFFQALKTVPATTVSLILYAYPLTVTLLSVPLFRLRLDRPTAAALCLTTAGCLLVFSDAFSRRVEPLGLLQALGSMLSFSAYLLFAQHVLRRERPITLAFYVLVWTTTTFCAANLPPRLPAWGVEQALVALGLGVIPTTIAVSFLYRAIEAVGSARTSLFSSFEPVTTVALAYLLLGEEVSAPQLAGAACIVAGIALPSLVALQANQAQLRGPPADR